MASQSSQIYYIVDDTAKEVEYDNNHSSAGIETWLFNNTSTEFSSLQMKFDGTSVLFVCLRGQSGWSLTTTIDNNPPSSSSLRFDSYGQLYQSPTLDDTAKIHTLNTTVISSAPGGILSIVLDYIVVSPGKKTPLLGRTLMVDDMYSGLSFGSGWVTTETVFDLDDNDNELVFPFQNTTHRALTPGSMFSFSYTGSNLSLYGVFDWGQLGSYELTSTIDDEPPVSKTFDARNDPNPEAYRQQPNFVLFSRELEAGNHTATFTLSKCVNQTLIVDYITYKPFFSSLSTMPNLTGLTFPFPSDVPTSGPTSPTNPSPNNPANSRSHIAALVTGLVAGLVLLACLIWLLIWRRRRQQNRPSIPGTSDEQTLFIEPFHSIFQSTMHPRRQKQPITLPSNQANISGEKTGQPVPVVPAPVVLEAVPAQVDQQDLEDSNEIDDVPVAVVSQSNRRQSLDGLDQVHIAMRMQQEQIQAMRTELDALARPPDYQST
ncbi:hypothetical protein C8J56DRAFT_1164864 [Mycena floridula]|nr:hypothetical protein C8J56DRAFT_1164864 [Mycena floridula]